MKDPNSTTDWLEEHLLQFALHRHDTGAGMELLKLKATIPASYFAANMYVAALAEITKLRRELDRQDQPTRKALIQAVNALAEFVDGVNDAQMDDDRGRGHDAVVLIVYEEGGWRIGVGNYDISQTPDEFQQGNFYLNEQGRGNSPAELADYLNGWVRWSELKEHNATPQATLTP